MYSCKSLTLAVRKSYQNLSIVKSRSDPFALGCEASGLWILENCPRLSIFEDFAIRKRLLEINFSRIVTKGTNVDCEAIDMFN